MKKFNEFIDINKEKINESNFSIKYKDEESDYYKVGEKSDSDYLKKIDNTLNIPVKIKRITGINVEELVNIEITLSNRDKIQYSVNSDNEQTVFIIDKSYQTTVSISKFWDKYLDYGPSAIEIACRMYIDYKTGVIQI